MSKKVPNDNKYQMVVRWDDTSDVSPLMNVKTFPFKVFKDSETKKAVKCFLKHPGASMTREEIEQEGSMPKKPILKGKVWVEKNLKAVEGRVIEIGWCDNPPEKVFVIKAKLYLDEQDGFVEYYNPLTGKVREIDSPDQVRKIGNKIVDALKETGFYND